MITSLPWYLTSSVCLDYTKWKWTRVPINLKNDPLKFRTIPHSSKILHTVERHFIWISDCHLSVLQCRNGYEILRSRRHLAALPMCYYQNDLAYRAWAFSCSSLNKILQLYWPRRRPRIENDFIFLQNYASILLNTLRHQWMINIYKRLVPSTNFFDCRTVCSKYRSSFFIVLCNNVSFITIYCNLF